MVTRRLRGGLHVLGRAPQGEALTDLLVSMVRLPRGDTEPADASLTRALAADLGLGEFDGDRRGGLGDARRALAADLSADPDPGEFGPLSATLGERWRGPRPRALAVRSPAPWRTCGDTVERLERLAGHLIDGSERPKPVEIFQRGDHPIGSCSMCARAAASRSGASDLSRHPFGEKR